MHVVLHPEELLPHLSFLRETPGAYEWWYFDAVSHDGRDALACVWFLGNPFSPYYRLAAQGKSPDPLEHNALFFALYRDGKLHAYHFSRFPIADICAGTDQKALLRFGPNHLFQDAGRFTLSLHDENANRRTLSALLTFTAPPTDIVPDEDDGGADEHLWCPAAPACAVSGQITLRGRGDGAGERITFAGHGYHDHNRGALPFSRAVRDWYWARALLTDGTALIVYHVRHADGRPPVSHLLRFRDGKLLRHDARADVRLSRPLVNAFGRAYKTQLTVTSGDWNARFTLRGRLDSAPFYVRARVNVTLTENGKMQTGDGMGEWFCPHPLASALVASATKARIVEQEAPRPPIPGGQDAGRL